MLGEPGHGKSSLCMKMVSDFCERKFCPKEIKKVFSFSLNPTVWIKELENSLDVKNIFILPHKQIMLNGKYNDVILDKEYLEESLIFLDGYDELYLKLQEYSKNTISFLEDLKIIAKDWNLKIIVTSRKTCINPSDLYKYGYKICQLTKLTKKKQKEWINDVYNTKLSPEKPYDIERLYNSFEEDNIQSKILEFLLKASGNKYDIEKMYNMYQNDNIKFKVLELLELPILLQLIVSKYFYDDAQNIAELYDKLFEEILNTRKEMTIGSFDEDKAEEFKQIFGLYAYNIYQNNDTYTIVESTELEKEKNIKWKSLLLFYITSEKKQKEYYIEFVHRSFYQYFQAWYFYNLLLEIVKKNKKRKVANLFEAICERKLEKDVIDMIGQISQNQKEIQKQEQINFILDIFEKTDGFIKTKENGKCCIPIGESNVLDRAEILMYNLLMLLNIILPNGLTLLKNSRVETLMKKFDMNEIYLPKITMSGLTLDKVNFIRANLKQADLKDTTLEGAHLEGAYLEKADLEWTHLERADLRKAHLERADLKGADLRAANLEKANLEEADLKGADLGRAHLENAHLGEANLGETDLQYAHLKRADLEEVYLVGAHLRGVHLENANLIKADFDPIILKYAILENTKISKNKFDGIATLGIDVNKIIWCD